MELDVIKIIITGASGFVGKNLVQYLGEKKVEVIPMSLRDHSWQLDSSGVDAIIHLAGKAHDTQNTSSSKDYFEINTELTKRLFNQFLTSDIQDFFFFSSVKAVADTVEDVLEEKQDPQPYTPYGKSKLLAEEYLLAKELPEGKRVFIIRPCMIHGEGNKGNLNLLYKIVEKGVPWFLASFENQRSFLSIDNLNFVIFELLKNKEIPSGIYNVSDDESLSTNALISIISNTLGKKPKLWYWSTSVIFKIAKIGDAMKLPLNTERLKKLTESYVVSNQKIKSALGIEKLPYTAEEGLVKTLKSFHNKK
ncbi:NAD-dependent epimerase/dehydratase family protein [Riemerella anatipestifer]|uniref:NAD-dependent epimerase/dehydratase family protein n=1 Tax=Riemerella anatipestifer TaxID=34085 RepID=A0AAP6LKJ0_RIEAN|nr:NAD-dependent epimerase/dehydratase family protein [Riemerella anatipestifer]MCU7573709.1 NAD-dependent epimerase/dehydratase family protein [Riemerella anatipestifer]MCU7594869.1 NAD-dependent epimerase/dehydratase family protein [Riemerella anatipestifer]MCW0486118.1 NAD-dependent epimerase/dehydratase family protein [Riemerella anatipestifer]MCW0489200.1 NAD-dependent epimerase/dehydratase family protein [Riemerella anatipestifer]MDR7819146.1 NAD-dependent epimerase/dehydratase family pr